MPVSAELDSSSDCLFPLLIHSTSPVPLPLLFHILLLLLLLLWSLTVCLLQTIILIPYILLLDVIPTRSTTLLLPQTHHILHQFSESPPDTKLLPHGFRILFVYHLPQGDPQLLILNLLHHIALMPMHNLTPFIPSLPPLICSLFILTMSCHL